MKSLKFTLVAAVVATTFGCVSTSSVGYTDGWVTTSPVSYRFSGPPLFQDMTGRTYHVEGTSGRVAVFDRNGMQATSGDADVIVRVGLGEVQYSEPGAMQLGKYFYPAFTVTVPYQISIHRDGAQVAAGQNTYDNALTFKEGQRFESREQAVAAIDAIRKLAQKGIDERARKAAAAEAAKNADTVAAQLFEDRNFALEVPVVRSAAGLDLQPCYEMLVAAQGPEQVQQALSAYEQLGTDHRKEDGTPNVTANYGVACGIAACKLMLRDLRGAWDASKAAREFEPRGEEAERICSVIYQQEKVTGQNVIPEADRAEIAKREQLGAALQGLFAKPGR
ncbi:MAG: hypothetical protein KDE27_22330 [Planctomycetes bacterium]|nr:hypothetical protein [Planctomycetota bacterium]